MGSGGVPIAVSNDGTSVGLKERYKRPLPTIILLRAWKTVII